MKPLRGGALAELNEGATKVLKEAAPEIVEVPLEAMIEKEPITVILSEKARAAVAAAAESKQAPAEPTANPAESHEAEGAAS